MRLAVSHHHILLLDFVLWPVIKVFSRKKSFFWQWRSMPWLENAISPTIPLLDRGGDVDAEEARTQRKRVLVLKPYGYKDAYQIGIKTNNGDVKFCTVIIPAGKKVALHVGAERIYLFAFSHPHGYLQGYSHPLGLEQVADTLSNKLQEDTVLLR